MVSKREYEAKVAATRDGRMRWWREARFGMFVHYGLYAQVGRNEWVMAMENIQQASTQNAASTQQVESSARNLDEVGQRLKGLVAQYQVE